MRQCRRIPGRLHSLTMVATASPCLGRRRPTPQPRPERLTMALRRRTTIPADMPPRQTRQQLRAQRARQLLAYALIGHQR